MVPRLHYPTLASLPEELLAPLLSAGRRIGRALRAGVGAEGVLLALNDEVSQSVGHVHLHVVPRRGKDGLRGFLWPRTRYGDDAHAAQVAGAIRAALD